MDCTSWMNTAEKNSEFFINSSISEQEIHPRLRPRNFRELLKDSERKTKMNSSFSFHLN